jgi:hypothetical protein
LGADTTGHRAVKVEIPVVHGKMGARTNQPGGNCPKPPPDCLLL